MKKVYIKANSASGFKVEVNSGEHLLIVDQPHKMGGGNEGASPLDYLLASLGSCLITVGVILTKQERLPVKGIQIEISGEYDPEVLMGNNKESRSGFQAIQVLVEVDAPGMSQEEIAAFVNEVENRCPVTDNLRNPTPINFALK